MKKDYLPFKFNKEEKWGMISTGGKILFSEKYEDYHSVINDEGRIEKIDINITPALNGFFLMTNKENTKDYYTATKNPQFKFGGFKDAALFREDIAPTVKKGEWIKFINKKGKVVFEFKEVNGVNVKRVSNFFNGVAIFELDDETYGCIDTRGNIVVSPQKEYISFCETYSGRKYVIENGNIEIGNKIYNLSKKWEVSCTDGESNMTGVFSPYSDYWVLSDGHFGNEYSIIYKNNGQEVKRVKVCIEDISGDKYIFSKNQKLGLANLDGEILMAPSYDAMKFIDSDKVICGRNQDKKVEFITLSGECIYQVDTDQVYSYVWNYDYSPNYSNFNNGVCYLREFCFNEWSYYFRDCEGGFKRMLKEIKGFNECDDEIDWIQSDYFDPESIIKKIKLTNIGACGISTSNTLRDFYHNFSNNILDDSFRNYISQNQMLPISLDVEGTSIVMIVYFSSDIYPNYTKAFDEKPYGIDINIDYNNFSHDSNYHFYNSSYTESKDNVIAFFEYLYKYYCENYPIQRKEKKENTFYLEIIYDNNVNSVVAYLTKDGFHIAISESDRSFYYIFENMN